MMKSSIFLNSVTERNNLLLIDIFNGEFKRRNFRSC